LSDSLIPQVENHAHALSWFSNWRGRE